MSSAARGAPPSFGALVQAFFAEHLTQQRALSPRTVAAYRDAFMLFLGFAQARLRKAPTTLVYRGSWLTCSIWASRPRSRSSTFSMARR